MTVERTGVPFLSAQGHKGAPWWCARCRTDGRSFLLCAQIDIDGDDNARAGGQAQGIGPA